MPIGYNKKAQGDYDSHDAIRLLNLDCVKDNWICKTLDSWDRGSSELRVYYKLCVNRDWPGEYRFGFDFIAITVCGLETDDTYVDEFIIEGNAHWDGVNIIYFGRLAEEESRLPDTLELQGYINCVGMDHILQVMMFVKALELNHCRDTNGSSSDLEITEFRVRGESLSCPSCHNPLFYETSFKLKDFDCELCAACVVSKKSA